MTLMKVCLTPWRMAVVLAFSALLLGIPAAVASSAATSIGYVALGNLSASPSPVDVYLYSAGDSTAQLVEDSVAYGTILPYQQVNAGNYTVKMRTAGSSPTSTPAWSVSLTVKPDGAYIVAPLRTTSTAGALEVIDTDLTAPKGEAFLQVIQADLDQPKVTFHCSCGGPGAKGDIVTDAAPGSVSKQAGIPPGPWIMTATGTTANVSRSVPLTAGQVHTEIVIKSSTGGIQIEDLLDAAAPGTAPTGGVSTGLGGTASHGPGSPLPWLAVIGAGVLIALAGGLRLSAGRLRRLTARG